MFRSILLAPLLGSTASLANTATLELPIVEAEPTLRGHGTRIDQVLIVRDVAPSEPDTTAQSTWPDHLSCRLESGDIYLEFHVTVGVDWPTSWPDKVTCSAKGHDLEIALTSDIGRQNYVSSFDEATGISLTMPAAFSGGTVFDYIGGLSLQQHGPADATLHGAPWPGVSCSTGVYPSGAEPGLRVVVDDPGPAGVGTCPLALSDGTFVDIPIALTRPE